MRELSKFKVLGITLLVTVSSCVVGTLDMDAKTLRNYGFEFDLSSQDKIQTVSKYKKQKQNNNPKFGFKPLIESGRNNNLIKGLSLDNNQGVIHLGDGCFNDPGIVQSIRDKEIYFPSSTLAFCFFTRAGPSIV